MAFAVPRLGGLWAKASACCLHKTPIGGDLTWGHPLAKRNWDIVIRICLAAIQQGHLSASI